jgi:hypothetical protein
LHSVTEMVTDKFVVIRQGGAGLFQFTLHKNLNAYHRIEGVPSHASIHVKHDRELSCVSCLLHSGHTDVDRPSMVGTDRPVV